MSTLQAQGPEVDPRTQVKKNQAWRATLVTLALGRQRQADLWNLLAGQPSLTGEFQANERPYLKIKGGNA